MMNFLTVTPDRGDTGSGQGKSKEGSPGVDKEGKSIPGEGMEKGKEKQHRTFTEFLFMRDHRRKEDKPSST